MVPSWVGILHNFVIVVATVQNVCMAEAVHVQVFDAQDVVVYAAVAFGVEFDLTFVVVIVVAVTVELVEFVAASDAEEFAVFVVVAAVFVVALGVLAVVKIAVFGELVVSSCVASGDSTWMRFPSIVEYMGMTWA